MSSPKPLHVGIVGGGLGGLAAAIAIARGGAQVTVLEAAAELGEIGAGIQLFPNASRFLLRWGVDKIIGDNLVQHQGCNTYTGSEMVSSQNPADMLKSTGYPWFVVRRDHLLDGLAESARQHGVSVRTGARVTSIEDGDDGVSVVTKDGTRSTFGLVIGADGLKSIVRHHIAPGVEPIPPSHTAAYRATLPYEKVLEAVPEARAWAANMSMDTWNGPNGYVLTYPISGGRELNVVTAFSKDDFVTSMENVDIDEFRSYYEGYHPLIRKVIELVPHTKRWPLLQMPPMQTWSNPAKNIVLLGDAAHCMQNHVGQGAATAIEDGAFLGRVLSEVIRGVLTLPAAIGVYEKSRIPKAWMKQQISYVSGMINTTDSEIESRNKASKAELHALDSRPGHPDSLPPSYRSWQIAYSPMSVPGVFCYDAEGDADMSVLEYLQSNGVVDDRTHTSQLLESKIWGFVHTPDASAVAA